MPPIHPGKQFPRSSKAGKSIHTVSYGFRPHRAARDAAGQCFCVLRLRGAADWILDADIAGCFDNISKDWLVANIPTDKAVLRKWLNSGYMQEGEWHATQAGTPQGGIISPTLANMTLDGLERQLKARYGARRPNNQRPKVHLIRCGLLGPAT
ncbi:reverse transcriptase domain-containing protein [Asticcacaulis sp. MM231]|uniref:reverse transcriptase domain-containing protein n=1 Tax=Asticcacaulis sp. MM231 TaxID=3157666 RepID=UPI0032D59224